MPRKLAGFALAICMIAVMGLAQTASELLQKGIFAQETEGNLDNAILLYRQIVNSAPTQRDLAAQAQYRLAQALLQKGDLNLAATEFGKLARDYSDYKNLVSNMATQARRSVTVGGALGPADERLRDATQTAEFLKARVVELRKTYGDSNPALQDAMKKLAEAERVRQEAGVRAAAIPGGRSGGPSPGALAALTFDPNRPVVIRGKATTIMFMNPAGIIMVDPGNGGERYRFVTASPTQTIKQGFTKGSIKPGDEIVVTGILAADGGAVEEGPAGKVIAAQAATISLANGTLVFDRAKVEDAAK